MSNTETIENILRSNYPNAYFRDGYVTEVVESVKLKLGDGGSLGEMRRAITSLSERNPDRVPNIHEIARQIRNDREHKADAGVSEATASHFLNVLRDEPDLEKRWSMICNAGDEKIFIGRVEDSDSRYARNHAQLFVEKGDNASIRAQTLADRHRIEYRRFTPPKDEQGTYLYPTIAPDEQKRGQEELSELDTSTDIPENENGLEVPFCDSEDYDFAEAL